MASGARAVGADPLVDTMAHRGSECPTPAGRDAEERGRVIWVEGLDGVANPREEQPETDAKAQSNENRGKEVAHVRSLQCDTGRMPHDVGAGVPRSSSHDD